MASIKKMKTRVAKFMRKELGLSWADAFKCVNLMNSGGYYDYAYYLSDKGYAIQWRTFEYDEGDGYTDSIREVYMKGYLLGHLEYMYDHYVIDKFKSVNLG